MARDNKRSAIFEAAIEVFAHKGFEKTTVDEIAEKAGIAKGTIYYHFDSKEELFFAIIDSGIDDFAALIHERIDAVEDPKERLEELIAVQLDFFNQYRNFCRVLLSELWHLESRWQKDTQKIQERYLSIIREIIEEGKASGYLKPELDTKATTTAFFGLVAITSLDWALFRPDVPRQTMYETIRTIFLDGALAQRENQ